MHSSKIAMRGCRNDANRAPPSDFEFLLRSMEREKDYRDKQNSQQNYSRTLHLSKYDQPKTINFSLVQPFCPQNKGKKSIKEPSELPNDYVDSLIYKIKKYLSVTDQLIYSPLNFGEKLRKQAVSSAQQLIDFISCIENENAKNLSGHGRSEELLLGSNKSLSSSYHFPNGVMGSHQQNSSEQPQIKKKMENLYSQKLHLQNLISQHERANIKMFIKINEGESEEIEMYKRQLASLFQKYKQLEKLVKKEAQRSKALSLKIIHLEKQNCGKQKPLIHPKNQAVFDQRIKELQSVISEQNEALSMALQELEQFKNREEQYKIREKKLQQMISAEKSKAQLASSCNDLNGSTSYSHNFHIGHYSSHSDYNHNCQRKSLGPIFTKQDPVGYNIEPLPTNRTNQKEEDLHRMIMMQANVLERMLKS